MAVPFTVFLIRGYIHNIPVEMEEAASLDGCTLVKMFYKIILPLLKPILFTGITINTFWFWNDFLLPQLIISDETLRINTDCNQCIFRAVCYEMGFSTSCTCYGNHTCNSCISDFPEICGRGNGLRCCKRIKRKGIKKWKKEKFWQYQ